MTFRVFPVVTHKPSLECRLDLLDSLHGHAFRTSEEVSSTPAAFPPAIDALLSKSREHCQACAPKAASLQPSGHTARPTQEHAQFGYDLGDFVLVRVEVEVAVDQVAVQVAVAVAAMWKTWYGDDADTPLYGTH